MNFKILAAIASLGAFGISAQATEYTVDGSHSHVGFTVRHLISKLPGRFKDIDGKFTFDPADPKKMTGKFTVKTASVNTENEKRDDHLRNSDFFDSKKFPSMSFEAKKLVAKGKNKFALEGDLTIKETTKPVTFDMEYSGSAKDPWGNTRAGFAAVTKINRKDYGITWNKSLDAGGVLVGDEVEIALNVEAVADTPAKK